MNYTANKTLVVIGGGGIGKVKKKKDGRIVKDSYDTIDIDKEVLKLSGKNKPKALFIGTATYDKEDSYISIKDYFNTKLNCDIDNLKVANTDYTKQELESIVSNYDVIYVGGGHTEFLVTRWQEIGLDLIVKKAYEQGTVIAGRSAGAICWFDWVDNVDQQHYVDNYKAKLIKSFGLVKGIAVPHFDEVPESERLETKELFKDKPGKYYGIDNCVAMIFENDNLRVLSTKSGHKLHTVLDND